VAVVEYVPPVVPGRLDAVFVDEEAQDVFIEDAAGGDVQLSEALERWVGTAEVDVRIGRFSRSPLPRVQLWLEGVGLADRMGVAKGDDLSLQCAEPVVVGVGELKGGAEVEIALVPPEADDRWIGDGGEGAISPRAWRSRRRSCTRPRGIGRGS
jgi:hypothetical protein